jgi:NAD(P)-dependent dehydrogenase (short-subunit alcohol dehydrogenase family)
MQSLNKPAHVAVVGAGGGIGAAFVRCLAADHDVATIWAFAREPIPAADKVRAGVLDLLDEASIAAAAELVGNTPLDAVIVATGLLHDADDLAPEKSWRQLDMDKLARSFAVNAAGPALVAKHFLPRLARDRKALFAALSARVGSIEDNRFGGWYGYRASKAALNQLVKTLAIELVRRHPQAVCVGLHPGTTDTRLSAPFQTNVPAGKLFSPDFAASHMLEVLDRLGAADTGGLFAWDGERIPF